MAQQFLDGSQIRAVGQKVGRVGVAEAVRVKRAVAGQHAGIKLDDLAGAAVA